jgi:NAD(P)-dependent dehydrogenase (short-subunit alcohol dehydrogenase family)
MRIIVISASSDIGYALCLHWLNEGHEVIGTYRTKSEQLDHIKNKNFTLLSCDLSSNDSILKACHKLSTKGYWDQLVICPGTMLPIGAFESTDFQVWQDSINVNFTAQLKVLHQLLPYRGKSDCTGVIFFAGGGTNSAPVNFSAYTLAKISLIKACELLDVEIDDCKFTIIGPGWVKTKIHQETITASDSDSAGAKELTNEKMQSNDWTKMSDIAKCCDWILTAPKSAVGGRNFSVVHDNWLDGRFIEQLISSPSAGKLRRHHNALLSKN